MIDKRKVHFQLNITGTVIVICHRADRPAKRQQRLTSIAKAVTCGTCRDRMRRWIPDAS